MPKSIAPKNHFGARFPRFPFRFSSINIPRHSGLRGTKIRPHKHLSYSYPGAWSWGTQMGFTNVKRSPRGCECCQATPLFKPCVVKAPLPPGLKAAPTHITVKDGRNAENLYTTAVARI